MKTGKVKRGKTGERTVGRSERVFGIIGHPGQAKYCLFFVYQEIIAHFPCLHHKFKIHVKQLCIYFGTYLYNEHSCFQ